jgi:glucokinase
LFRAIYRQQVQGRPTLLTDWTGGHPEELTVPLIVQAAQVGDEVALETLHRLGHWLGIGIASLLNALNPELVIFGGVLSHAADILLPIVDEEIQTRTLRWNREPVRVVRAAHGSDACVRGGVATVYQYVLAQPNLINSRNGGETRQ